MAAKWLLEASLSIDGTKENGGWRAGAARHRLPTMYNGRALVERGGLISYGANFAETYRLVGSYAGKVLRGAKPADLPVVQPTRFELLINLNTAKALGLAIPQAILARADEVIE